MYKESERLFVQNLFKLDNREGRSNWFGWVKGYFKLISLTNFGKKYALGTSGQRCEPIVKIKKYANSVCCTICWNNRTTPIHSCIFYTPPGYNHSNLISHLRSKHGPEVIPELISDSSTIATTSVTKASSGLRQNLLTRYGDIKNEFDQNIALGYLYTFFTEANIAIVQSNNPNLQKFIDYVIDNGHNYKTKKHLLHFSEYKYKKQEILYFSGFVRNINNIIKYCKEYYNSFSGNNNIPFLNVSHDGWDSKDNDVLGVSIHFIVPSYWKVVNVAIGLKRCRSKKSKDLSEAIEIILSR